MEERADGDPGLNVSEEGEAVDCGGELAGDAIDSKPVGGELRERGELLFRGEAGEEIEAIAEESDGGGEGVSSPVAGAGEDIPIGGDAADGFGRGRERESREDLFPGDASHADFVAAIADADRFEHRGPEWEGVEETVQRGSVLVDDFAAHVVAAIAGGEGDEAFEFFLRRWNGSGLRKKGGEGVAGADAFDGEEMGQAGGGWFGEEVVDLFGGEGAEGGRGEIVEAGGGFEEGEAEGVGEEADFVAEVAENGSEEERTEGAIGFGGGRIGAGDVEAGDDPDLSCGFGEVLRGLGEPTWWEDEIGVFSGE